MKVARLKIENFRGIKNASIDFDGHTLMVGSNNVGKSTICDALDLVLGPDRLNRFPPVEEFDFYNGQYLHDPVIPESITTPPTFQAAETDQVPIAPSHEPVPIPIRIEVVLIELTPEVENRCGSNLEFWNTMERRLLRQGEADEANPPAAISCLRLETIAQYNPQEDEFEGQTYFSHSPHAEAGELTKVRKDIKRLFGFLYLRALRTGSRALSLERGSLLDILLRLKGVRTGLWEKSIERLRNLDMEPEAPELVPVLKSIEERLSRYIPSNANERATKLYVSQLTREHLRKTMSFFLAMSKDQNHVPFQLAGTGTLNTLVLALLSFIAELKPDTVIFAMEEPEIAVPPHTQRRIADYLLQKTTQAFVTSHSPYVIERFEPSQTLLLSRDDDAKVSCKRISEASGLKENDYKRYARRGLTECMLGKGAIVVEGLTEFHALPVVARRMEEANKNLLPLDIAGVAFFDAETESNIIKFGTFFKALGLKTFSFYDYLPRKSEDKKKFSDIFDIDFEHKHAGFEALIAEEVPVDRLWIFLSELYASGEGAKHGVPATRPTDDTTVRRITKAVLMTSKGAGWAARLIESCTYEELPITAINFLTPIYPFFPKPTDSLLSDNPPSDIVASAEMPGIEPEATDEESFQLEASGT
jgi:putative ATP-dependent endonuclease of OLD family